MFSFFFPLGPFSPHSLVRSISALLFGVSWGQTLKEVYLRFSFQGHLSTDSSQMLTPGQTSALSTRSALLSHPAWDVLSTFRPGS